MLNWHEDRDEFEFWVDQRVMELVNEHAFYSAVVPHPKGVSGAKTVSLMELKSTVCAWLVKLCKRERKPGQHAVEDAEIHAVAYGVMDYWRDYFPADWYSIGYLQLYLPKWNVERSWEEYRWTLAKDETPVFKELSGKIDGILSQAQYLEEMTDALVKGLGVPAHILMGGQPGQQGVPAVAKTEDEGIEIKTVTYIDGQDVEQYTVSSLAEKIAKEEAALSKLEQLKTKPKRVLKNIEERRQKLQNLVDVLDKMDEEPSAK